MVRCIKLIFVIPFLFSLFVQNVLSIESAVHKAEVTKCIIISSFVYNANPPLPDFKYLASVLFKKSKIKSKNLEISDLSIKEMKKEVENNLTQIIKNKQYHRIKKLLEYCEQTFKIGN